MTEQQTSTSEHHRTRDRDDVVEALLVLVEARARQLGCRTWADLVDRDHPGHGEAQIRAAGSASATTVALWSLAFELHGGYAGPADQLSSMLDDFTDRMQDAWKRGYIAGFDGHPWDTSDVVERVEVRGEFL